MGRTGVLSNKKSSRSRSSHTQRCYRVDSERVLSERGISSQLLNLHALPRAHPNRTPSDSGCISGDSLHTFFRRGVSTPIAQVVVGVLRDVQLLLPTDIREDLHPHTDRARGKHSSREENHHRLLES